MSVFDLLSHLLHGNQQQSNFQPAPMQKVNLVNSSPRAHQASFGAPEVPTYQANQIRLDAQKRYNLTPLFTQNLINAAPYVGHPMQTSALVNSNAAVAQSFQSPQIPNQIVMSPPMLGNGLSQDMAQRQADDTLIHEGLHRIWGSNPQVRQQFTQAYDKGAPTTYLQNRVAGYSAAQPLMDNGGVYTNNFKNLQSLPSSIQNEIHSYIPEYYSTITNVNARHYNPVKYKNFQNLGLLPKNVPQGQPVDMPGPLRSYYSQYYKVR